MTRDAAASAVTAARSLFNAGNYTGAERLLRQALAADPEHAAAHVMMSLVQYQCDRPHDALESAEAALALVPTADAFRAKALALTMLNRRKDAVAAATAAVAADPIDEFATLVLAMTFERAKKLRPAEAAYRRALQLAPGNAALRADFGLFLLRRGRLGDAEREATAIDTGSDRSAVLLLRAKLALFRGRTREARDIVLWLLANDAANPAALELLMQIKASESRLLGFWWRYSLFLGTKTASVRHLVIFPLLCLAIFALGPLTLVVIAYLWCSKIAFAGMNRRALQRVRLRKDF